ncbi:hypothetical protein [Alteromonas sp. 14N.309.X.WAT.G.H12]|uniref:hypothetical protein n=1 Tax=Alteromonas sp. 14N.309.X.WAT.G.H12 TaxID=3120824 RepID=UPI002FD2596F
MKNYKVLSNPQVRVNLTPLSLMLIQQEQTKRQAGRKRKVGAATIINECITKALSQ